MLPISTTLSSARTPAQISVLVLTRNEQVNIADCLGSLSFSDDIVILDSLSTDRTTAIARQFPHVRVVERAFDIEWKQRNYGLHDIQYKHPWVYVCDADERVPKELAEELRETVGLPEQDHVAYRLRYQNMFMGRWIRHATGYPVWIIRLVRPDRVTYEQRKTNIHPVVDGSIGELKEHFVHYSFNRGLVHWFNKHNYYSTHEASEGAKMRCTDVSWRDLASRNPMARRRAIKNLSYLLPMRSVLRFMHSYVLRKGFLDGSAGLRYCVMVAMYEYWIQAKMNAVGRDFDSANLDGLAQKIDRYIQLADMASDKWANPHVQHSGDRIKMGVKLTPMQWLTHKVWPLVPGRPAIRMVADYLLQFGFLKGRAGWQSARLMACYELMAGLLYREKLLQQRLSVDLPDTEFAPQYPAFPIGDQLVGSDGVKVAGERREAA